MGSIETGGGKMSQSPGMMADGRPLGIRMFDLFLPGVAVMAGSGGLGFRMWAWCAPAEGRPLGVSFERLVRCCGRLGGVVRLGAGFCFRFREVVAWRG